MYTTLALLRREKTAVLVRFTRNVNWLNALAYRLETQPIGLVLILDNVVNNIEDFTADTFY